MKINTIIPILLAGLLLITAFDAGAQKSKKKKKGSQTTITLNNETDSASYALGLSIGESLSLIKGGTLEAINVDVLAGALRALVKGDTTLMDLAQAQLFLEQWFASKKDGASKANLKAGRDFLTKNRKMDGVVETATGLQYLVIKQGDGAKPALTDQVTVHYVGTLLDGSTFDSSVKRGKPSTFPLNGVIKGWQEGLALMSIGSKYRFWIPTELAYGATAKSPGGPNTMLIFEVELLKIN